MGEGELKGDRKCGRKKGGEWVSERIERGRVFM